MRLISVNLGQEQTQQNGNRLETTGIYKNPTPEAVHVSALGLKGDVVCDTKHHGGPDQAVYVYGGADYAWWAQELGRELAPGTFGENLTISGLESAQAWIGDRLMIGSVLLEVTSPRIPCVTLAARMGDPAFARRFRQAERPGLYCRVLQEGQVRAGDLVTYTRYPGQAFPALEMFRDFYEPQHDEAALRRHLAAPVHYKDRTDKEQKLAKILASKGEMG
jgi:MOSC domain-containing protein YiiM